MAIFWAFFHSSLTPTIELGAQWPPLGIEAVNPFELPLLNTVLLLSSGATITYSHHSVINGGRAGSLYGAFVTVILALIFTLFQGIEYSVSSFTISDGAFGTCFFFGTGLNLAPIKIKKNIYIKKMFSTFRPRASDLVLDRRANNNDLNPNWVTGFCDAESSFSIRAGYDKTSPVNKVGEGDPQVPSGVPSGRFKSIRLAPIFSIELHEKDYDLLKEINDFFGVGTIIKRVRHGRHAAIYSVQSIKALKKVIIPHFHEYNFLTQKREDFRLFCLVVDMLYNNKHKTDHPRRPMDAGLLRKGLYEILSCKASMSKGLSGSLLNMFPDVKPAVRNQILPTKDFNPFWVAGFVDGEGCFYIKTTKTKSGYGYTVNPNFSITQHIRDIALLENLVIYLNCGLVDTVKTRPTQSSYVVYRFDDIINKIIPFFEKYPLRGNKLLDFYDFKKVVNIRSAVPATAAKKINKYDESCDILKEIMKIKNKMNRNR